MNKKGILLTILSGVIYGLLPLMVSIVYSAGFNAVSISLARNVIAIPLLLILIKIKGYSLKVKIADFFKIVVIATIGNTATSLLLNASYRYIPTGSATTLHFIYPLLVTLICVLLFKDKLSKNKIICLVMSFIGIVMFIDFNQVKNIVGVLMAVMSGLTFAIYLVGIEKTHLMEKYNSFTISYWLSIVVCINFVIISYITKTFYFTNNLNIIIILILISLFGQIIGVIFLQKGIKYIGASNASLFSLFEPLTSMIIGILVLNESITLNKIVGSILIIYSVYKLVPKGEN